VFESISSVSTTIGRRIESVTSTSSIGGASIATQNPLRNVDAVYTVDEDGSGAYELPVQHNNGKQDISTRSGLWLQGSFTNGFQDDESDVDGLNTEYDSDGQTISLGLDFAVGDSALLGISIADTEIEIDRSRAANDQIDVDGVQLSVYVQAEANYAFRLGKTGYITPLVALQYTDLSSDSFTEVGGLNASIGSADNDFIEAKLGFKLGERITAAESLVDLYFTAAVVYDFGDSDDDLAFSFSGVTDGPNTSLSTFEADEERLELGVGVNWYTSKSLSFGASLNGQVSDDFYNVNGQVQVKLDF